MFGLGFFSSPSLSGVTMKSRLFFPLVVAWQILFCSWFSGLSSQEQELGDFQGFDVVYGDPARQPSPSFRGQRSRVMDPITVASPDGAWRYTQVSMERKNPTPSTGRLMHRGALVWESEFPLSFDHLVLTDSGELAGCGLGEDYQVWRVSRDGRAHVIQRIQRTGTLQMHASDNPRIHGLLSHPDADRLLLRAYDPTIDGEEWLIYRFSNGEPLTRCHPRMSAPDQIALIRIADVRALRDAELFLVQWNRRGRSGVRFRLVDFRGEEVWSHDLPREPRERDHRGRTKSAILSASSSRRFELAIVSQQERVSFAVEKEAQDRWAVREVARSTYAPAAAVDDLEEIVLSPLGTVELDATQRGESTADSPVDSIAAFDFDESGAIEFLRDRGEGRFEIVSLDFSGEARKSVSLSDVPDLKGSRVWCRVSNERWVLLIDSWSDDSPARAWSIDRNSGKLTELLKFACPAVDAVAPDGLGGFVVVAAYTRHSAGLSTLRAFDEGGRLRWRIDGPGRNDRLGLPEDVTITKGGQLVVLRSKTLQLFDLGGTWQGAIDLEEAWGQVHYPTDVFPDEKGDVIVLDSGRTLWRTSLNEAAASSFEVTYSDGGTHHRLPRGLRVAPDGTLWTSDGNVLLQLDETGREISRFGRSADSADLVEPRSATIDEEGRVCILDAATNATHVFDLEGHRLFTARLDSSDGRIRSMTTDGRGVLHCETTKSGVYTQFDRDGARIGEVQFGGRKTRFLPGAHRRWTEERVRCALVDEAGEASATVQKLSNGLWLHSIRDLDARPDGSLAVLDWELEGLVAGRLRLGTFDPDGTPRETYEFPRGIQPLTVSYGDEWIACLDLSLIHI